MRLCPVKTMAALLAVTALVTLDSSTLSVVFGLLPIAAVAALAFAGNGAVLDRAIRWLRRRMRAARRTTRVASPGIASHRCPNGLAVPALATRGPPV